MTRASTSRLAPGEHTAERSTPVQLESGKWRLKFSIRYLDGRLDRKEVTAATKGEARRKAKKKAEELLRTHGGVWSFSSPLSKYVNEVSVPAINKTKLSDMSRERYATSVRFLNGDCKKCRKQGKRHKHGFNQHTIGSGTMPRALDQTFTEIAELHGLSTARSCRTVWNKYIAKNLERDGLINFNPLLGQRLRDVTGMEKPERTRGGRALTRATYDKVLNWLLAADPSTWLVSHKKYGWIWRPEVQIATHQAAIDMTLLQATTGLRQSEARLVDWSLVSISPKGVMSILVSPEIAKGGHERVVLVLDQRVTQRLLERRDAQGGTGYVIGAPMDPTKFWNRQRCGAALAKLFVRMAEELVIEVFESQRSHIWRTTLRSFYEGKVPEAVLNSQFGHSTEVAKMFYTDASDLSDLEAAATGLRT